MNPNGNHISRFCFLIHKVVTYFRNYKNEQNPTVSDDKHTTVEDEKFVGVLEVKRVQIHFLLMKKIKL